MQNKFSILAVIGLLSIFQLNAQELSLHFMSNIAQSGLTNPGLMNRHKISINLPSMYMGYYNSSYALSEFSSITNGVLKVDSDKFMNLLDEKSNSIQTDVSVESFALAIRLKKFQFSIGHQVKLNSYIDIPKGLFAVMKYGNGAYVGETLQLAPYFDLNAYHEVGLGLAYQVNEKLVLGMKTKILSGLATVKTEKNTLSLYTDPEIYQLTAETDILIHSAGLPFENTDDGLEFGNLSNAISAFGQNMGVAFDLGASYQMNNKFFFSASVLDLGSIKWKKNISSQKSQGEFTFEGIDLQSLLDTSLDFEELADSLSEDFKNTFEFEQAEESFSTNLPTKFYISGIFTPQTSINIGALIYGERRNGAFKPSFALSIEKEFKRIFTLGATYSMRQKTFNNFGIHTSLRLGPIQWFLVSDNILPIFNPMGSKSVNLRTGLNIAIGK